MARAIRCHSYSLFPTCPPLPPLPPNDNPIHTLRRVKSDRSTRGRTVTRRQDVGVATRNANISPEDSSLIPKPLKHSRSMDGIDIVPQKLRLDARRNTTSDVPDSPTLSVYSTCTTDSVRPTKRPRPGPVTNLIIIPYTDREWRIVMEEVKKLFIKGQYKHCAMRCKQILKSIPVDPTLSQVHPIYTIYLSFYCASALEQTARSLHNHSSTKLPLFHEALSFYKRAESLLNYATFSSDHYHASRERRGSQQTSASSIRSSVSSIFSQSSCSSTTSSVLSSPLNDEITSPHRRNLSTSSILSRSNSGSRQKPKKRVSFSELYPLDEKTIIAAFPNPPSVSPSHTPPPLRLRTSSESLPPITTSPFTNTNPFSPTPTLTPTTPPLFERYHTHLLSFSPQLSYHITSIHVQISLLSDVRKTRRSNGPNVFGDLEIKEGMDGDEMMRSEWEARIRRGRESGWERVGGRTWDGTRYRELCEKVEEEIFGGGC